ncbi:MAG TPA: SDR family NAD(P)-dependent oxidoreductase [Terriglobales bacterium]|jgi:NAD(P)-dependent dehydrogenase (short-subunit alcohol dehydrogenase family)
MTLEGKQAVVTGASRGIGRAIAAQLVAAGADVIITGRNASTLEHTAREIGARAVVCDHTREGEVEALFAAIAHLDFLINNVGAAVTLQNADKLSPAKWREIVDVNLTSTFTTTHFAVPKMNSGGVIVNNSSVAAKQGFAGMSAYCAAKHGVVGFTLALREELRPRGIRVMSLVPGATDTEIWDQFWREAPRKKMMSTDTVAQMVVQALTLPPEASVDEVVILPSAGTL